MPVKASKSSRAVRTGPTALNSRGPRSQSSAVASCNAVRAVALTPMAAPSWASRVSLVGYRDVAIVSAVTPAITDDERCCATGAQRA